MADGRENSLNVPKYHARKVDDIFREFSTSPTGLKSEEAEKRLKEYGPNELKEEKKLSPLKILLEQFNSFIVWILIAAVAISMFLGDYIEGAVIIIILIMNALIGFFQEYRAEKAIKALKKLAGLKAKVLRDGGRREISASMVVPGDIIFVETGDKIQADARLFEISNLEVSESSLTGESTPVAKDLALLEHAIVAEQKNMIFSGTIVTKGRGRAVVVRTGMKTEIGRIAEMIEETEEEETPLQKRLDQFGKFLGYLTIGICIAVFLATVWRGEDFLKMFETSVSLAVAAIPEGLPAVVTLSLALGVQRMIKRNALIRRLASVETLGSTTVICTDKTGTLTRDEMTVRKIYLLDNFIGVTGEGYSFDGKFSKPLTNDAKQLLQIGALCNDSSIKEKAAIGDPTEAALIVSAAKAGIEKEALEKKLPRVGEVPFDSERKMMSTLHKQEILCTKGAPDMLIKHCTRVLEKGKIVPITATHRKKILAANEKMAQGALRVLGMAYRPMKDVKKVTEEHEKELIFVGLQGMIDPPREEVKQAIQDCEKAGIKVVMITGDHRLTAMAIAHEIGIEGEALTGEELDSLQDFDSTVERIGIYARVSPGHKMKIVQALKKKGHIVAMTGDGVNDAPAIKASDIGIAMGIKGTDVAKESSDMILTDDNFTSIKNAVEEGREIYDNIRKFIYYLLSSNLAEVLIIFAAILIGLKLPLVAIQLLWINLVTDGLPAIALGLEPTEKNVMARKPRPANEPVITKLMGARMLTTGLWITIGTLGVFVWALTSKGWHYGQNLTNSDPVYLYALTMTFTTLVFFELFNAINAKSEQESILNSRLFSNKWMLLAIASSVALQLLVIYLPPLDPVFDTVALSLKEMLIILTVAVSVVFVDELFKLFARKAQHSAAQETTAEKPAFGLGKTVPHKAYSVHKAPSFK